MQGIEMVARNQRSEMACERAEHTIRTANDGTLRVEQIRVLRVLNCGGMPSRRQIEMSAGLTRWKTRQVIAELVRRDLIFVSAWNGRYAITVSGRETLGSMACEHAKSGV
ncbi:hypothetical protein [Nocardia cyriacigeorgica]|uniref:hypothetical protein n=1 Tax=Nocardia cyriacigeorgica TaxID=135487 RepID=UPI0018935245|nr:hypothetical protein [Nocardia cyriacigeorgica]